MVRLSAGIAECVGSIAKTKFVTKAEPDMVIQSHDSQTTRDAGLLTALMNVRVVAIRFER